MAEVTQAEIANAKREFDTLCRTLDEREWHYDKHEEDMTISCGVSGDDIPMRLIIRIMPERQLAQVLSPLPFDIPEDKRVDVAMATTMINDKLANGSFDFDLASGRTVFRLTSAFMNCNLSTEVYDYMIGVSAATVDEYNDKIMMLCKGMLDLSAFAE